MVGRVLAKSELAAAIGYSLTRWQALTRYLDDDRIEAALAEAELDKSMLKGLAAGNF